MKKLLVAMCSLALLALSAHAADGDVKKEGGDKPKKPELTAEQKAVKKELTDKYDANKDGKLDKDERAKMSDEDKAKWKAAFPSKKKAEGEAKSEAPKADAPKADAPK